jgi:branched-chain amino acid transport system ATP-binding protein
MSLQGLRLHQVRKSFGATRIIDDVTLDVRAGESIALIGPNGAGKSTLFNMISGRIPPSGGSIELNGESLVGVAPFEIYRKGLSRSFQVSNIFPTMSVSENIRTSVLWSLGYRYSLIRFMQRLRDVRERADAVMEEVGLQQRRNVPARELTYAELRSLEIAMAISGDPQVVLLDEPTAGMSRSESEAATRLIQRISKARTLIMVEHDMSVVFGLADRIAVLSGGSLIACDTPQRIREDPAVREAYLGDKYAGG